MKILQDLIKKSDHTMGEIEKYAEKAHLLKDSNKHLADTYIKIAEMHITIYDMLHSEMVNIIEEYKRKGHEAPESMKAIWDYEHERLSSHFHELKFLVDDYKKTY